MTPTFPLAPVDASFLDTARHRYVFEIDLDAPADQVWAGLTADEPQGWCRMLTDVRYTSPAPHRVGTSRRSVVARGVLSFRERFFVWDEAVHHHAFYVEGMNVPLLRAFAEDYLIVPTERGCRLTWTIAFESRRGFGTLVRLGLPAIAWLLRSLVKDTERAFTGPVTPSGSGLSRPSRGSAR